MDLKLQGKKAIITGGTRGIGKKIAEVFLSEGMDIAICGRNLKSVQRASSELSSFSNTKVLADSVDISNHKHFEKWIEQTADKLKGLDVIVFNAGAMVAENTDADWMSNFNVDLLGAVHGTKAALPFLEKAAKRKGDAAIVYVASISGSESHHESSYGPIKAALIHFCKGVAKQHGHKNIRANVISPGPVYFEEGFWEKMRKDDPKIFNEVLSKIPLGRMAKPEDIAYGAAFLASPLSSYTTGENLVIDGGLTQKVFF